MSCILPLVLQDEAKRQRSRREKLPDMKYECEALLYNVHSQARGYMITREIAGGNPEQYSDPFMEYFPGVQSRQKMR